MKRLEKKYCVQKYKNIKVIKEIIDEDLKLKISNFNFYCLRPFLVLFFVYIFIIVNFVAASIPHMLKDGPMIFLYIVLFFIAFIPSLYTYLVNYYTISFTKKEIIVKNFFGKTSIFNIEDKISTSINAAELRHRMGYILVTDLCLFNRTSKEMIEISLDAINDKSLVDEFYNNFIYE